MNSSGKWIAWFAATVLVIGGMFVAAAAQAGPALTLKVSGGNHAVEAGDVVTVTMLLTGLDRQEAAGAQAFLEFDPSRMEFLSGVYTSSPFGLHILSPIQAVDGMIDLASGIDVFAGQPPVSSDSVLAVLNFIILQDAVCVTSLVFREHHPPTTVTDPTGSAVLPLVLAGLPAESPSSDINGDGFVNVDDLLILLAGWGPCTPGEPCPADLNCDGEVNVDDLLILLANWG